MQTRSKTREIAANISCGRVKMDQGLWSKLPAELLERVLLFLSVPHLCRFRVVCNRWKTLISSPKFGKLCVLNASKSANTGAFLVVRLHCEDELPGLSILDLNERRWYNPKHELPKGYNDVSAMDGGLVCALVDPFTEEQRRARNCIRHPRTNEKQTLVVFNLLGGASKELPNPPWMYVDVEYLKLIVDSTSNTFKVVIIKIFWEVRSFLSIYESSTDQWRTPPNPPLKRYAIDAGIAIFQGLLYVFCVSPNRVRTLCSFNFLENSWKDTGVQFSYGGGKVCDLVVSDNRLFMMTHQFVCERDLVLSDYRLFMMTHQFEGLAWALTISEIFLADKECRTVVCVKQSEVVRNFNFHSADAFHARAFGFNKSILLMSKVNGKVMLYSLTTGEWELLPQIPYSGAIRAHGIQTNYLRLPDTPW